MNYTQLINDINEAFAGKAKMPIALWYSDAAAGQPSQEGHCMFSALPKIDEGLIISFSEDTLKCGGGKTYCGFRPLHPNIPKFVSGKERYKATPEMVEEYVDSLKIKVADKPWLNLARLDQVSAEIEIEGIFFLAPPDIISGLAAWAFYDNNQSTAVQSLFASGCASTVSFVVGENRRNGRACFLGMMDISARKFLQPEELCFSIPYSRLKEMASTIRQSCLFDAPAWALIKSRL